MDVRPAGTNPASASFSPAAARVSAIEKSAARQPVTLPFAASDSISLLLKEFSPPDLLKLLQVLEPPPSESAPLLATIVKAASEHDMATVISAVQEMASLNPQLAEGLRSHPELSTMRPEIEQLLNRLSSVVKWSAEEKLNKATELVDMHAAKKLPDWDTSTGTLLRVSRTLLDSGGLSNYVKADEVAQVMIDALRFLPLPEDVRIAASLDSRRKLGAISSTKEVRAGRRSLNGLDSFLLRARGTVILLFLFALAILMAAILLYR